MLPSTCKQTRADRYTAMIPKKTPNKRKQRKVERKHVYFGEVFGNRILALMMDFSFTRARDGLGF